MLRIAVLAAAALALGLGGVLAQADSDYPNRPVRLIAAAAPGGNPDVLARLLSQKLSGAFGKAFVVENVPGAGGVVAAKMVAATPPDGHVLMLGDSGAMAINVVLNPDLGYDPLRDFTPITALVTVPTVLVVHPSVPARTLPEFIALAKSKPGQLAYGSAGPGSIHHLTMAIFAAQTGIDLLHVPYRGGTALVGGLVKGEVQAGWSGVPNVLPLIEDGKLRVLCISTQRRSKSVADLPTAIELGIEGFDYATMMGLQMSAGAPRDLVARLQATVAKALREPDMVDRMAVLGMDLHENGTEDYVKFMKDDIDRYRTAIRNFKLQIN
ncbi:MAG TPA: tripartite tricarboxylate transporter substrate binding protein [Xanthobacteraceae bacterium]|jgi:tripartite-type tricarboxylate transporter receptor subunit TctC|nr:tripartite tricarboxylate transporter substrate binding protein [Xanthobacteraceae bacterium]